jgi:hypothetical protein
VLSGLNDAIQDSSAFRQRKPGEETPLVDQDVKGVVENARLCGAEVLQQIEVWSAVWTERYQLSIFITVPSGRSPSAVAMY